MPMRTKDPPRCRRPANIARPSHRDAAPSVSVVVPTYRRNDLLERCLGTLAGQDFDPRAYEVVVADDAASPDTQRLVEGWAARTPVAIHYVPVCGAHGPAAARNAGWRAARGAIIAFTDDDCLPDPAWLATGTAAFARGVAGAWGRLVMPLPEHPTDYQRDAARLIEGEFVTANCFCRRQALEQVGGFDERFTLAWREDSDLFFSLLGLGKRLVHVPDAVVVHPVRPATWGVSLRQQRKSEFNALLYKKHPRLYRQRIQAAPPWHYYASVAALGLALTGPLCGAALPAALAATLWLGVTARFCIRRLQNASKSPRHVAEMAITSVLIPPLAVFWRLYGAVKYRVVFL